MSVGYREFSGGVARAALARALGAAGLAGGAAIGLAGCLAAPAMAADLPAIEIPGLKGIPDSLTWNGITLYGAIDVGYAYQTNGRPLGSVISGLEYVPFTTTRNYTGQSVSTIQPGGMQQSFIGLKLEKEFAEGWLAVGKLDTGFDPVQGQLSNGCLSFVQNAGVPYNQQTSNADSSRCGQAFNGNAYAGVSNRTYGTLTVGRQNTFELDTIAAYDPQELSYAFSFLGYNGADGGSGSTQAGRWDNSVKYIFEYGPVHVGGMYGFGGSGTGMFGNGYAGAAGFKWGGFSIDGNYTVEHGAVNLQTSVNDVPAGGISTATGGLNGQSVGFPAPGWPAIAANISDNFEWTFAAKYTFDFTSHYKGGDVPGSKFTLFAGYTHIDQANPQDPVFSGQAEGGQELLAANSLNNFGSTAGLNVPNTLDNNAFTTDKITQIFWTGAKYELPSGWTFTAAYYHANQNSYIADNVPCSGSQLQCAGSFDEASLSVDYRFNKHFDVYGGVSWARVNDGLAYGFPGTPGAKNIGNVNFAGTATSVDTANFVTGIRLKF